MGKYVGNIEFINGYYNFYPLYEVTSQGVLNYLTENERSTLLDNSQYPNVNLYYNPWDDSFKIEEKVYPDDLYVFEFTTDEFEDNVTKTGEINKTKYRYSAKKALNEDKLYPISRIGYYKVISEDGLDGDIRSANTVGVKLSNYHEGEEVLVRLNDRRMYLGPYRIQRRTYDKKKTIVSQIGVNKFIGKGYSLEDCKKEVIEEKLNSDYGYGRSWEYYRVRKSALPTQIDLISDEKLLEDFIEASKNDSVNNDNDVAAIINNYSKSAFVGGLITDAISKDRTKRLLELVSSKVDLSEILELANAAIIQRIHSNPDADELNSFMGKLFESYPELIDSIQSLRIIKERISAAKQDLENLENQREQAQEEIKNLNNDALLQAQNKQDEAITLKIQQKENELDELCRKLNLVTDYEAIKQKIEKDKKEALYFEQHKNHLSNETGRLESQFVNMINGYSEKIASITFDGFIASKMLQSASAWEHEEKKNQFEQQVEAFNRLACENMEKSELIDYLTSRIQSIRPLYDKNMIINLMICITQGFLTIFSGLPGCGKTSACNLIGKVLGLNKITERIPKSVEGSSYHRFVSVSVERGWTSKRDFIGYYNPLTKSFEESNREVYDALKLLDAEKRIGLSKYPFIILLDEANLSPMEYYWADFMNVCDDLEDNNQINIGNGNVLEIPETLHFCATMNNDHTTETLSPRLIDRAWIISLPRPNHIYNTSVLADSDVEIITWESLKKTFCVDSDRELVISPEVQKILETIKAELEKEALLISPRAELAIRRYLSAASNLMEEDEYGNSADIIALDYAISQKVLPMISGSGDGYLEWLNGLKIIFNRNNLRISEDIIDNIIESGNRQMKYYQFFM